LANHSIIYDQIGSATKVVHADSHSKIGDEFVIETVEDVEPIIERARQLRENQDKKANWRFEGSIPMTVVEQAMREGWMNDQAKWRRWLDDPANKYLRGF
jgi:hypothetical protein